MEWKDPLFSWAAPCFWCKMCSFSVISLRTLQSPWDKTHSLWAQQHEYRFTWVVLPGNARACAVCLAQTVVRGTQKGLCTFLEHSMLYSEFVLKHKRLWGCYFHHLTIQKQHNAYSISFPKFLKPVHQNWFLANSKYHAGANTMAFSFQHLKFERNTPVMFVFWVSFLALLKNKPSGW